MFAPAGEGFGWRNREIEQRGEAEACAGVQAQAFDERGGEFAVVECRPFLHVVAGLHDPLRVAREHRRFADLARLAALQRGAPVHAQVGIGAQAFAHRGRAEAGQPLAEHLLGLVKLLAGGEKVHAQLAQWPGENAQLVRPRQAAHGRRVNVRAGAKEHGFAMAERPDVLVNPREHEQVEREIDEMIGREKETRRIQHQHLRRVERRCVERRCDLVKRKPTPR